MGESSAQTVREIEDTRDRLEQEFRELEDRLPKPARWVKRAAGVVVGGGAGGAAFWFIVRRRRKKKAGAVVPVQAVVNIVPNEWAERVSGAIGDGRWKPYAAGATGLWVFFRLAELRQLRRLNRAIVAGAR